MRPAKQMQSLLQAQSADYLRNGLISPTSLSQAAPSLLDSIN